ncbi:ATP-binding protein [Cellulomonas sp.]|uniref:AlbA family DNA-binding domain-containing protein n=1 Tax=Cellulomonas sp. TaxID=40001 RepID=UPI001B16D5DB|nr:ATP-binding protein [Cellulomonas sp.]MBO9553167.1 ATP-binding protein [Cellulomonas sp.]
MVAPFALDGAVDEEKLSELIAVGTELDVLDFKATLDLSKTGELKHRLGFVKDVAAFSTLAQGGYIVVGVDGKGRPAHAQAAINPAEFDEANLRTIANSYLDGRLTIISASHQLDNRDVAVIYVGASVDYFPPMVKKEGWYPGPGADRKIVFRPGDVFVRDGTSCRRIEHRDWSLALANFREKIRAEAAADIQQVVARIAQTEREAASEGRNRRIVIDISMEASDFEDAVADAIESGLVDAVRRALRPARAQLATAWAGGEPATYGQILDRLASVAGVALRQRNMAMFDFAVSELYRTYKSALVDQTNTHAQYGREREASTFWREIISRVLGILAMAVREEAWEFVRPVVLRRIGDDVYADRSWFRHAITEASRAGVLVSADGQPRKGALIRFARSAVTGSPVLHEDVPVEIMEHDPEGEARTDDLLLDSLCQADFLWCVVAVADAGADASTHDFYPSCAGFYSRRSAPVAQVLATRRDARHQAVGPDDRVIAEAINLVNETSSSESGRWGQWSVMTDAVTAFVRSATGGAG